MRQRVVGAIGISCDPEVLIADEPTTSLDATIQAQYLRLLRDLQDETGVGIVFITHDFGIVAKMCDRVAVMYAGKIVEQGDVRQIFNNPSHPYTEALIYSVPKLEETVERLYSIPGQPPALWNLPPGCSFAPRCPYAFEKCHQTYPDMFQVDKGQAAACWKLEEKGVKVDRVEIA
jgi:oligopeptide/dipeptide ABC transporter ATP-binding protein